MEPLSASVHPRGSCECPPRWAASAERGRPPATDYLSPFGSFTWKYDACSGIWSSFGFILNWSDLAPVESVGACAQGSVRAGAAGPGFAVLEESRAQRPFAQGPEWPENTLPPGFDPQTRGRRSRCPGCGWVSCDLSPVFPAEGNGVQAVPLRRPPGLSLTAASPEPSGLGPGGRDGSGPLAPF